MTRRRRIGVAILGVCCAILAVGFTLRPEDETPRNLPAPIYVVPPGSPSLASWADRFEYSFGGPPAAGAPQLGPVTRNGDNGDSVNVGGVFAGDTTFLALGQTANGQPRLLRPSVHRLVANRAILTLPPDLPANSLYLLYAQDSSGRFSLPVPINRADTWWLNGSTTGSDHVIVGDTVSVYGRNLSSALKWTNGVGYDTSSPSTKCDLWLHASVGGTVVKRKATCTSSNPYRAQFTMPAMWAQATSSTSIRFQIGDTAVITTQAGLDYPANLPVIMHNASGFLIGTVKSYSGTSLVLTVTAVDPYARGSGTGWTIDLYYDVSVYVHNGHGGPYGWSEPLTLHVNSRAGLGINYTRQIINLDPPSGDKTGVSDRAMIQARISDVDTLGGPFRLVAQSGTYWLDRGISLTSGYQRAGQILGQGAGKTIFKAAAAFSDANVALLRSNAPSELNSVTVDCSAVSGSRATNQASLGIPRLVNCILKYPHPKSGSGIWQNVAILGPGNNFFMTGCDLTGFGVYVQNPASACIDRCNFYGTEGHNADGLCVIWGGTNIQFTNNTGQHLAPGGRDMDQGPGRIYVGALSNYGTQRNVYISGNSTPTRYENRFDGVHDGEIFLFDGSYGTGSSLATAATHNTVTIADKASSSWKHTRAATITSGPGEGQTRVVARVSGNQLTLDRDWDVVPVAGQSLVNIVGTFVKIVIYNNSATGGNVKNDGSRQGNSNGFHWFGGGNDLIVDGNAFKDMNYGWSEWALNRVAAHGSVTCPLFFCEVKNTTFDHCNVGVRSRMDGPVGGEKTIFQGNLRRNLTFTNCVVREWELDATYIDLDLWQNCTLSGAPQGIWTDPAFAPIMDSNLIDTSFIGNGLPGSVAKTLHGGTTNVHLRGTSAFTQFASGNNP
jgi:hypothetical protein